MNSNALLDFISPSALHRGSGSTRLAREGLLAGKRGHRRVLPTLPGPRGESPYLGSRGVGVSKLRVGHGGRGPGRTGGAGRTLRAGAGVVPPLLPGCRLLGSERTKRESRLNHPHAPQTFVTRKESEPWWPLRNPEPREGSGSDRPYCGDRNTYFAKKKKRTKQSKNESQEPSQMCAVLSVGDTDVSSTPCSSTPRSKARLRTCGSLGRWPGGVRAVGAAQAGAEGRWALTNGFHSRSQYRPDKRCFS